MEYVYVDKEGLFWSNEDGWVEGSENATIFGINEVLIHNKPIGTVAILVKNGHLYESFRTF